MIEKHSDHPILRKDLELMKAQGKLVILMYRDLLDWQTLKTNKFKTRSVRFNL